MAVEEFPLVPFSPPGFGVWRGPALWGARFAPCMERSGSLEGHREFPALRGSHDPVGSNVKLPVGWRNPRRRREPSPFLNQFCPWRLPLPKSSVVMPGQLLIPSPAAHQTPFFLLFPDTEFLPLHPGESRGTAATTRVFLNYCTG